MKKFVLCILGIGLPIYILPFILRGIWIDLIRLLKKNVYAIAKGYGVPDYHHKGRAMYALKGVDESRNEKEYTVGTSTPNDFIKNLLENSCKRKVCVFLRYYR